MILLSLVQLLDDAECGHFKFALVLLDIRRFKMFVITVGTRRVFKFANFAS